MQTNVALPDKPAIDPVMLSQAREQAIARSTSLIRVLEETYQGTPDELVTVLGEVLRMPVLTMDDLHALHPAFDRLSFALAAKRECMLLQKQDQSYLLAVSDPFRAGLRDWVDRKSVV